MKFIRKYGLIVVLLIVAVVGCKKYVNDTLTKRKFNKYITGTWKMTKYEVDGIDSLQYFTFYGNDEFVITKERYYKTSSYKVYINKTSNYFDWVYSKKSKWFSTGYPFLTIEKYIDTISGTDTTFMTLLNPYPWKIDALTNDEFVISQFFGYSGTLQERKITCLKTAK